MTALIPYVRPLTAAGSHGEITFCPITGRVLKNSGCDCGDCRNGYADIIQVDMRELRQFYADHWPGELERAQRTGATLDVLELSCWSTVYGYTPAEPDFRLLMLNTHRDGIDW